MSFHVLHTILNIVHEARIPTVILETHYVTVTDQVLTQISELLSDREVVIELGLESAEPQVLDRSLGKYIRFDLNDKMSLTLVCPYVKK